MLSRSIKFGPVRAAAVGAVAALQLFTATAQAQEKTPIRVGVMLPFTGSAAATGQEKFQGIELAVAETGFSIGGHKIELLRSDDQNNPNVALTEARRLVENEDVTAILGNLSSAVSIAINPYTARHSHCWSTVNRHASSPRSSRWSTYASNMETGRPPSTASSIGWPWLGSCGSPRSESIWPSTGLATYSSIW